MDDITDSYFDAQARLDSLRQQEASLLEILSKAEKLEDVVQLQTALSDVRYQIESQMCIRDRRSCSGCSRSAG